MATGRFEFDDTSVRAVILAASKTEITRLCIRVSNAAKQRCPVDTGTLRRSISFTVDASSGEGRVSSNVEYAIWVEQGTRHWRGKPFLEPALREVIP